MRPKVLKRVLLISLSAVLSLLLIVLLYVVIITLSYKRIGDLNLEVLNNTDLELKTNQTYKIATYNIGFGAYDHEFSFFMDGGASSKAKNKEIVNKNTLGVAEVINSLDLDFVLLQELDLKSTRSQYVNQHELIYSQLNSVYSAIFANYYDTLYLLCPPLDPIGSINSNLVTYSKYRVLNASRKDLPVSSKVLNYLFDLDRCFSVTRLKIGIKELVIVNIHLSAYENEGIRDKQLKYFKTLCYWKSKKEII